MAMEKFLADQMLLRLGRWLRLSGHDVLNPGDADDPELAAVALKENRTLITRDRGLKDLCTRIGASCILIRSNRLQDQLGELASAGVVLEVNPRGAPSAMDLLLWPGGSWSKNTSGRCPSGGVRPVESSTGKVPTGVG
jgi:predicted nuclease of predicted toxin-antitoxin system